MYVHVCVPVWRSENGPGHPALPFFAFFSEDKSLPELAFWLGQQSADLRILPVYTLHPQLLGWQTCIATSVPFWRCWRSEFRFSFLPCKLLPIEPTPQQPCPTPTILLKCIIIFIHSYLTVWNIKEELACYVCNCILLYILFYSTHIMYI